MAATLTEGVAMAAVVGIDEPAIQGDIARNGMVVFQVRILHITRIELGCHGIDEAVAVGILFLLQDIDRILLCGAVHIGACREVAKTRSDSRSAIARRGLDAASVDSDDGSGAARSATDAGTIGIGEVAARGGGGNAPTIDDDGAAVLLGAAADAGRLTAANGCQFPGVLRIHLGRSASRRELLATDEGHI